MQPPPPRNHAAAAPTLQLAGFGCTYRCIPPRPQDPKPGDGVCWFIGGLGTTFGAATSAKTCCVDATIIAATFARPGVLSATSGAAASATTSGLDTAGDSTSTRTGGLGATCGAAAFPSPWYAFETQCCSRLEYSQWEQFPPEQSRWEHHRNKCRRPDNQIHHHEFPSS